MISFLATSVGLGLLLSIMLGPIFFVLLETSIKKGVKAALFLDLGILLSDLMYISIAYIFVSQVAELKTSEHIYWLHIIGGIVFIIFGYLTIKKKRKTRKTKPEDLKTTNYFGTVLKGFFLNAVNPGLLFYWFGMVGILRGKEKLSFCSADLTVILYITLILVTFFTIDVFKILGAKKLKNVLTPAWMNIINRVLGIILICIGSVFLFKGILQGIETL